MPMDNASTVTVLMPTFGDDGALATTLPRIQAAIDRLSTPVEWLVLLTPTRANSPASPHPASRGNRRVIVVRERGKSWALQVGACEAKGDILLVVDGRQGWPGR